MSGHIVRISNINSIIGLKQFRILTPCTNTLSFIQEGIRSADIQLFIRLMDSFANRLHARVTGLSFKKYLQGAQWYAS